MKLAFSNKLTVVACTFLLAITGCDNAETTESTQPAAESKAANEVSEETNNTIEPETNEEIKTDPKTISYSFGIVIGNQLKGDLENLDFDSFKQGVQDAYKEEDLTKKFEQARTVLMKHQETVATKARAEFEKKAVANTEKGSTFLAENGKKDGVVTLSSGLQYKIVTAGTGASPKADDKVEVHYRGKLLDGKEFDSSYARGNPATFPVNRVIKGWTEALQLMKEGAKWEVYIPSDLAYGPGGTGNDIGPNATLIFDVELLKILPKKAKQAEKTPTDNQETEK